MPNLDDYLKIPRCPHCSVDQPNLYALFKQFQTQADNGGDTKFWQVYKCARCGGVVTAFSPYQNGYVHNFYPEASKVDDVLPSKVKAYLQQAIDSTFAPAGSLMLCASAVDSMLKEKGHSEGSLYSRINKAASEHLITKDMSDWAHHVRLDANDQRHADEESGLPTVEDAKKAIDFTKTLAEILFILPSRVNKGITGTVS
ncbi:MAG: DUF4145 domain-containing protein [Bacteroidota bacterium]